MTRNRHPYRGEMRQPLIGEGRTARFAKLPAAAALIAGVIAAGPAAAGMPMEIAAPGELPVLMLHAEGAQIYECRPGEDGALAWTFREPTATLMSDGITVGRHYAGPNWEHMDGSGIAARVAGKAPGATAGDIPWLKLAATETRGDGMLAGVTTVQRINTIGGTMSGPCPMAGALMSVPYSADYVFLRREMTR